MVCIKPTETHTRYSTNTNDIAEYTRNTYKYTQIYSRKFLQVFTFVLTVDVNDTVL